MSDANVVEFPRRRRNVEEFPLAEERSLMLAQILNMAGT
jgi:hypothetical protein